MTAMNIFGFILLALAIVLLPFTPKPNQPAIGALGIVAWAALMTGIILRLMGAA